MTIKIISFLGVALALATPTHESLGVGGAVQPRGLASPALAGVAPGPPELAPGSPDIGPGPPEVTCAGELEKCRVDIDCCDMASACSDGVCLPLE